MPTRTQSEALTTEGSILGTLQYMSPEQLEGRDADERSDVFALGTVIYEMVTGRKAFEGRRMPILTKPNWKGSRPNTGSPIPTRIFGSC